MRIPMIFNIKIFIVARNAENKSLLLYNSRIGHVGDGDYL
jgi:hypothetical protein